MEEFSIKVINDNFRYKNKIAAIDETPTFYI